MRIPVVDASAIFVCIYGTWKILIFHQGIYKEDE